MNEDKLRYGIYECVGVGVGMFDMVVSAITPVAPTNILPRALLLALFRQTPRK